MGGMIAQTMAIRHPDRVRSLTSIMSTTSPRVGSPTPAAAAALTAPPAKTREEAITRALEASKILGSPVYPPDEEWISATTGLAFDRAFDPPGFARQFLAVHASGDRTEKLRNVRVPTLVIHGADDPLVQLAGGQATADAIPEAELLVIPGMGHNMPRQVWPQIIDSIVRVADRAG